MLQQLKAIMAANRVLIMLLVVEVEDWVDVVLAGAEAEVVLAAVRVAGEL